MLRTRRRDNNVKPNRRLDRKSSRGMLYENEELRLKTININAEIERGQSDIKKLKRENEMLKKEIWCLRDEYDKLDKLLKEKKIDFSSSSTTYSSSSDSESCSSCTEEPEEVETSQNLKNVQKSHLKTIHDQFDHLSIVTEEASCENSDRNSMNTRHSLANDQKDNMLWTYGDKEAIKPDQSYPIYGMPIESSRSQTLPNQQHHNMNFFAPIQHSKSFDDNHFNQVHQGPLYPEELYRQAAHCHNDEGSPTPPVAVSPTPPPLYENQQVVFQERDNAEAENFLSKKIVHTDATNFYQNVVLVPPNPNQPLEVPSLEKKATDLIVKIDNQNFAKNLTYSNTTPSTTFSNGGNLEELLQDIESISQRGNATQLPTIHEPPHGTSPFQEQTHFDQQIHQRDLTYSQNPVMDHLMTMKNPDSSNAQLTGSQERLHKSELNVVLMPKAMPLIGFDKYKNIQRSLESLTSKNLDNMSASQPNLCVIPPPPCTTDKETGKLHVNLPPRPPTPSNFQDPSSGYPITSQLPTAKDHQDQNPFFFGHLTDNYVNSDYFSRRYNPENFIKEENSPAKVQQDDPANKQEEVPKPHQSPVENEENIKLKTSNPTLDGKEIKPDKKQRPKSPKMSITKKVSIHFKGKKEKDRLKKLVLDGNPDIKLRERKSSIFEWKNNGDVVKELATPKLKEKPSKHGFHQKTPSIESKKSTTETSNNAEPKTPNSSESEKKKEAKKEEKKGRKSVSISPDRARHVHLMHDGMKKHKKHSRRSGGSRAHRGSADPRVVRERSYSICTDRSAMGPGLGLGYGSFMYDDYSDRERTNSGSSCDSHENHRKMSAISNVVVTGKVPWCGCWGNGCL